MFNWVMILSFSFADKLKAGEEFTLAGGVGSIKLDPDMAMDFENASVASELPDVLRTADGEIIRYSALEKTAEFGSRGGSEQKVSKIILKPSYFIFFLL